MSMTREEALMKARARKAELAAERAPQIEAERIELRQAFMNWIRREREMFELMLAIRNDFGIASGEHRDAEQEWRRTWREMPAAY